MAQSNSDDPIESEKCLRRLVKERLSGIPTAYLIESQGFWRHIFQVSPKVLIPRPDTETLVECALELLDAGNSVLDLGTGSGIIGISVALAGDYCVTASDVCSDALSVAAKNAQNLGATVTLRESDWFESIQGTFDLICSNPPYVAHDDLHLQHGDLRYEPRKALDGGTDGLDHIRNIIKHATDHLNADGTLLIEHGFNQGIAVHNLLAENGFTNIESRKDLAGHLRVSKGIRAPISIAFEQV